MFNTIPDPGFSKDDPWIFPSSCWIRGSNTVSKFASLLTVTKRVVTNMEAGMFLAILLCNIGFTDAAVTLAGRSEDTYNIGSNVTIGWNYDNETEMFSVDWTFQNSTADILIMTLTPSVNAVVLNGFNVVHNDNGKITLTDVQTYNSGTYKITVTYTTLSKLDPGTGSFKLTVSETTTTTTTTTPVAPTTTTTPATTMYTTTSASDNTTPTLHTTTTTTTKATSSTKWTFSPSKPVSSTTSSGTTSTVNDKTSSTDQTVVIIGVSSAVGFIVIVIVIILVLVFWEKQKMKRHHQGYSKDYQSAGLKKGYDHTYLGLQNYAYTSDKNSYIGHVKKNSFYVGNVHDQTHKSDYYRVKPRFLPYGRYPYSVHQAYPAHYANNHYTDLYSSGHRRTLYYPGYMRKHHHSHYSSAWSARRPQDDRNIAAADYSVYSVNWR